MKIYYYPDVKKFIDSTNGQVKSKIIHIIRLLEEFREELNLPHAKKLGKGLHELRIYGKQKVRILYIFDMGNIILLHAFIKKTQRIPKRDLEIARNRRDRFAQE